MNTNTRRLMLAAALLIALAAGFGLARLTGGQDAETSHAAHSDDDGHASHGDDQAQESHADHGAEDGHDEKGDHDDHGDEAAEGEEGLVALTQQQIEASGIQVVALGRGGGSETRLSGRVESAIGARASVAASVGGRVERVIVAPGTPVRAGQPLAVIVSGYLMSTADGRPLHVFDWFAIPAPGTNPGLESTAGAVHVWLSYLVIALAVVHTAAALKHHFLDRKPTLTRMWSGPSET